MSYKPVYNDVYLVATTEAWKISDSADIEIEDQLSRGNGPANHIIG